MAQFGKASKHRLSTLHPDLQRVMLKAIEFTDFSIIDGLRNKENQNIAVLNGRSKAAYPKSRHNRSLCDDGEYDYEISDAVDIAPYPIQWPDIRKQTAKEYVRRMGRFYRLAGIITAIAWMEGVELRWGGDFRNFFDGPHFERVVK